MTASTNTLEFLLVAARDAITSLRRSDKSDRSQALRELLDATTDEARDTVVVEWGSALVRKSLRVAALSSKDEEVANVFWSLRDRVEDDGFDSEDAEAVEDELIAA